MSVTVRARHEYKQPLDKVWAVFCDPEFYQAKFEGIGHRVNGCIALLTRAGGQAAGGLACRPAHVEDRVHRVSSLRINLGWNRHRRCRG